MTHQDIFDSLARNAFDFLERGISEFDKKPKYSVIHFCSAVEMLLKARLMKEHWSLIVSNPDKANLGKFMAGDFVSVSLEEARARIRDVAGEDIGDDAYANFRSLANHRNKMVHFFHPEMENDQEARAKIVADHCRSWFHLHRLLHRWRKYFHAFDNEIASADRAMKGHQKYLSTKFAALKDDLAAASQAGSDPESCHACGFEAAIPEVIDHQISRLQCLVCDHIQVQVELECPHCEKSVLVATEGYAQCDHCEGAIGPDEIADALSDGGPSHAAIKDGEEPWQLGNCSECDGYETVVQRDVDLFFCASCFEIFDSVQWCGWCNAPNTGDMEHSYLTGCNHCEGKAGWDKD